MESGTEMYKFKSLDYYMVNGKRGFYVENIQQCHDFKWLLGEIVVIDGSRYKVTEVSRQPHSPPWEIGEEIGLMVNSVV